MNFLDLIWLIPLFPLCGAAAMLFFGRMLDPQPPSDVMLAPELAAAQGGHAHGHGHGGHHGGPGKLFVSLFCPGMVLLSFLFSAGAVWQLSQLPERVHEVVEFTWLAGLPFHTLSGHLATFSADWGFLLDPLSAVMILVVSGIGFLIHIYSTGYMAHDNGYYRFFGYLNLFVFFMLMLVLANNYTLLFVGWEGVGLCSYLLIGFYFHKKSAADAGKKAFIVNRVGDAGFIIGMLLTFAVFGTGRFLDVKAALSGGSFHPEAGFGILTAIAILFFVGATGKSAQVPLYVWLPDAMEGPTPVSALIHAATMVTAGVYMVARSAALFQLTPNASTIVAAVGAFTAIMAATIALVQNDIKRVLAYSTVSQLGYMFLALGVGAYWVAIFHLFTHAFFKALLFLCSGSVIHAMGGEQDMRRMGALKDKIPITHWTMLVGSVAIAGIPGLAGFFSKDEILWQTYSSPLGSTLLWFVGLATAGMTAFYMFRLMNMTFYGKSRVAPEVAAHIHESPKTMTVPLMALAAGSVLAGWLGTPKLWNLPEQFRAFERWLEPAFAAAVHEAAHEGASHDASIEWILMALSVAIAIIGISVARYFYHHKPEIPDTLEARFKPAHSFLSHKWYVDELYDFLFINGFAKGGGTLLGAFDRNVVDGGVNGAGWLTRFSSRVSIWWDRWIVDGAVRLTSFTVKLLSYPACIVQTGRVQVYAFFIVIGTLAFFGYYVTR
ncbi:MAG: NADH-quinone oxidoreductase subunit L [Acidobacteria bacterium]|nr:NADH-quinone oxidoreductase subunit L [Acidobacteriota bacterium]